MRVTFPAALLLSFLHVAAAATFTTTTTTSSVSSSTRTSSSSTTSIKSSSTTTSSSSVSTNKSSSTTTTSSSVLSTRSSSTTITSSSSRSSTRTSSTTATSSPLAHPPRCRADNCLRQLKAKISAHSPAKDCSSFLAATTTPTVYTTATSIVYKSNSPSKRAVLPNLNARSASPISAPPAYASSCKSRPAYISACSCIGVTASPVAAKPVTSTVTVTSTVNAAQPSFYFKGTYQPAGAASSKSYVATVSRGNLLLVDQSTATTPQTFVLNTASGMVSPSTDTGSAFYYYAPADRTSSPISVISSVENSYPPLVCSIDSSKKFTCKWKSATGVLVFCHGGSYDGQLTIAKDASSFSDTCSGGTVIMLTAAPA